MADCFRFISSGTNAFDYNIDIKINKGDSAIISFPIPSPNKRGVNDIAWQSDNKVTVYGTLCRNVNDPDALWAEIRPNYQINKCCRGIKVVNSGENPARFVARIIMN